ncbi:Git3 domain-containing protein [Mycena venus]|uniref:Git3 domain-containing protein n=1 Tax=Mycena venus TaxID=2733690 RepID=A0A8H7D4N6_9AGAR|nr:Git3 domain-containing protein [Mycena venus]
MSNEALLPDGSEWLLKMDYSSREVHGVTVLVVFSCFSLTAVVGLLLAISLSAFNTRSWTADKHPHLFVRTHVAAYFISLLISDLIQAIGSILNARWIRDMAVVVGDFCTLQGVLKQTADVATAFWTLVIAIHTFCLLFLELKSSRFTLLTTLIAGWSGIGAIVIAGPAALNTSHHGPFYGISGYWCWISPEYTTSRITLDYMFMFMAAAFSFVLYTLIFLRMRGNIVVEGRCVSFRRTGTAWRGKQFENQALTIAKQMLLYPVAYTIIILPIAASRFSTFSGNAVPFEVTIFSAAVFLLSGIVNVTLFTLTRRILPSESFKIPKWAISAPKPIPEYTIEAGPDSYYQSSGTYAESYEEKEKEGYSFDTEYAPPTLRIRTTDSDVPTMLAPPPRSYRGSGESVYNLYAEANSPIPLTPP